MNATLAYICGWKAAVSGESLVDNPLPPETQAWQAWRDGWFDQDDEANLYCGATLDATLLA